MLQSQNEAPRNLLDLRPLPLRLVQIVLVVAHLTISRPLFPSLLTHSCWHLQNRHDHGASECSVLMYVVSIKSAVSEGWLELLARRSAQAPIGARVDICTSEIQADGSTRTSRCDLRSKMLANGRATFVIEKIT